MHKKIIILLFVWFMVGCKKHTTEPASDLSPAPLIIDHKCTDINKIPVEWIGKAREMLHIMYGHTSHGSQLVSGMEALFLYHGNTYSYNSGGTNGALDLREGDGYGSGDMDHDCGYYPNWVNETRAYLGNPNTSGRGSNHPEINVIIWLWCGQAAGYDEQTMNDAYLNAMTELENEYYGVKFVYMTCHLDGTGADGNLNLRNEQIRTYCRNNNKILFDFADIESYDPDGLINYMELNADDACNYDSSGHRVNWADSWINRNPSSVIAQETEQCGGCAHSHCLNCVLKGRGVWWLWARLAGWNGK